VVVDADDLAARPQATLEALCAALEVPFHPTMLSWSAGPKACDGLWAPHWYSTVHQSTGWQAASGAKCFPAQCFDLLEDALPFYEALRRRKILAASTAGAASCCASFSVDVEKWPLLNEEDPLCAAEVKAKMPDPRNHKTLLTWVGAPGQGRLLPRSQASVSVFDSAVQGGDAAWEGLRVYQGRIFHFQKHLDRLFASAKALDFKNVHSKEEIELAVFSTLAANGMRDECHMRLTLSRGRKSTSSMNPAFNVFGCTLIVLAEWKPVQSVATYDNAKGVSLITASQRRNPPSCLDSKIHHNNLLNNILPKIQANLAGAADAIMLDLDGFVAETNACNLFLVSEKAVATPTATACLPGITRQAVMQLVRKGKADESKVDGDGKGAAAAAASGEEEEGFSLEERCVSLAEFCAADEVFTTGTMGELTPVVRIDGRCIGTGVPGPVTRRLSAAYKCLIDNPALYTLLPDN